MRDSASFHRQASEWACCVSNLAYSTWAVFEEAMGVVDKENLPEAASEAPPLLFEHHLGALPGAGISFRVASKVKDLRIGRRHALARTGTEDNSGSCVVTWQWSLAVCVVT